MVFWIVFLLVAFIGCLDQVRLDIILGWIINQNIVSSLTNILVDYIVSNLVLFDIIIIIFINLILINLYLIILLLLNQYSLMNTLLLERNVIDICVPLVTSILVINWVGVIFPYLTAINLIIVHLSLIHCKTTLNISFRLNVTNEHLGTYNRVFKFIILYLFYLIFLCWSVFLIWIHILCFQINFNV